MKTIILACTCVIFMACQGNTQQQNAELKTSKDSISYSLGLDIGKNIKSQKLDVNAALMGKALQDYLDSAKLALTDEQAQAVLATWRMELMKKQQEEAAAQGEKNKEAGIKFLTENKTKEGIKSTASGLQYKITVEGKGTKPTPTQTVTFHYKGTLIDGTPFDDSYSKGQPLTYPMNQLAPGLIEGIQIMSIGSKYTFYIPSELGYGERGAGAGIPPNSTLIFDIELLEVK